MHFLFFRTVLFAFIAVLAVASARAQPFETKAPYAFLIEAETGTVLYSKNADESFPPASLAKLMTTEIAFQALKQGNLSWQEPFFISEHAWRTGGAVSGTSTMFAEVGSSIPLEALLKGVIVQSANDGSIAIAEGISGSEARFAQRMTDRARALGLETSTFANSTGLPAEGQHVTAREITMLALHLWREYPDYYDLFSEPAFEWNGISQRNRNPLLAQDIGVDGLKTGHTEASGYAIVFSAERDGRRLFGALSGLSSERERVEESRKLLDWGMRNFERKEVFEEGEIVGQARVFGGNKSTVDLRASGPLSVFVPADGSLDLSGRIVYQGPLTAPIEEGAEIGKLQIRFGDQVGQEAPLFAAESVERGTLHQRAFDAAGELLIGWIR